MELKIYLYFMLVHKKSLYRLAKSLIFIILFPCTAMNELVRIVIMFVSLHYIIV